jgi:hypothetical protein
VAHEVNLAVVAIEEDPASVEAFGHAELHEGIVRPRSRTVPAIGPSRTLRQRPPRLL